MKKRGETQPGIPAEMLPAHTFEIHGDQDNMEAAAFTGTARRRPVGWIDHDPMSGTVGTVFVHPDFRGKGLGPLLHQAAGSPPHSEKLTRAGESFAKKTGGRMPQTVNRQPDLHEEGHITMLPDFAGWIRNSPTAKRFQ